MFKAPQYNTGIDESGGVFTLVPRSKSAKPGGVLEVDVYASNVFSLIGFQAGLVAETTDGAPISPDRVYIDESRKDFVFAGFGVVPLVDQEFGRIGGALLGSGVEIGRDKPAYLGTFSFRVPTDATGVVTVKSSAEHAGLWTDGNRPARLESTRSVTLAVRTVRNAE